MMFLFIHTAMCADTSLRATAASPVIVGNAVAPVWNNAFTCGTRCSVLSKQKIESRCDTLPSGTAKSECKDEINKENDICKLKCENMIETCSSKQEECTKTCKHLSKNSACHARCNFLETCCLVEPTNFTLKPTTNETKPPCGEICNRTLARCTKYCLNGKPIDEELKCFETCSKNETMCMGKCHDQEGKELSPSMHRKKRPVTAQEALDQCRSLCAVHVEDGTCRKTCDMMFQCARVENKDEHPPTPTKKTTKTTKTVKTVTTITSTNTEAEQPEAIHQNHPETYGEETVVFTMWQTEQMRRKCLACWSTKRVGQNHVGPYIDFDCIYTRAEHHSCSTSSRRRHTDIYNRTTTRVITIRFLFFIRLYSYDSLVATTAEEKATASADIQHQKIAVPRTTSISKFVAAPVNKFCTGISPVSQLGPCK